MLDPSTITALLPPSFLRLYNIAKAYRVDIKGKTKGEKNQNLMK
jgi:hypothetical protein